MSEEGKGINRGVVALDERAAIFEVPASQIGLKLFETLVREGDCDYGHAMMLIERNENSRPKQEMFMVLAEVFKRTNSVRRSRVKYVVERRVTQVCAPPQR